MRWRLSLILLVGLLPAICGTKVWSEEVPSGLAASEHPEPLQVYDCTGPAAGKTLCYTCRYGKRPTIAIFTRELSPSVAALVKQIDTLVEEQREQRLAAYVVIIGDDNAELETSLKLAAKENNLRHVPLTILRDRATKLNGSYGVAETAAVTVMLWRDATVSVSRGFTSRQLSAAESQRVLIDTKTILTD